VVYDFDGDGVFDREEGRIATTIGLDVNNDGIFWGAAEYRKIEEVIDVCGTPLQISGLDPAGGSITFRTSQLAVPKVESPIPAFSVETNKGPTGSLLRLPRKSDGARFLGLVVCALCRQARLDGVVRAGSRRGPLRHRHQSR